MVQIKKINNINLNHFVNDGSNYLTPFVSPKYLSNLGIKVPKESSASYYLVHFFLKIINTNETKLSQAISRTVIELDNLAQQIDAKIDSPNFKFDKDLSVDKFINLETKIIDCFSHLAGERELNVLILKTVESVNESFIYNSTKRHLIYDLELKISDIGCTTMYLFPLINYLCLQINSQTDFKPLFCLIANYIQLLDDFVDVFDDINLNIKTPITEKYNASKPNLNSQNQPQFIHLTFLVKEKLKLYFNEIAASILSLNNTKSISEILQTWGNFHDELNIIPVPKGSNIIEQKEYLKKVNFITPPFICYAN